jgi:probable HAF family extracellular repeat protein
MVVAAAPLSRAHAALGVAALCLAPTAGAQQAYSVAALDAAQPLSWSAAYGIDETGRAVGAGLLPGSTQVLPVLFEDGTPQVLPILPGDDSGYAFGVGDSGIVVGSSSVTLPDGAGSTIQYHPVVWTLGLPTDLRTLVTVGDARGLQSALGIAPSGMIVGGSIEPTLGVQRGYVFMDGVVADLGALNGSPIGRTYPARIGASEIVVGGSESSNGFDHAFRWARGSMTDLHVLGGIAGGTSRAFDVNRFGVVCGAADFTDDSSDATAAAVWSSDAAVDLGPPGAGASWAAGLNDFGVVVGSALLPGGTSTAFRWKGGVVEDLQDLIDPASGWQLSSAEDVDNNGRIVGLGIHDGMARPYVLTPDCPGGFAAYGAGCPGTGGTTPTLVGVACPTPGEFFALVVQGALAGAPGGLFVGTGTGSLPIKPNCMLQVMPLLLPHIPLPTDGHGSLFLPARLEPGTQAFTVTVQYLVVDPGAPFGIASTNPLRIDVR